MRQTACLVVNPIKVNSFAYLFNCTTVFLLFVVVLSGEPKQNQGRGLVDYKLVQDPSNYIAGLLKAALLFWFFGDFRCGMLLFLLYINIEIGKTSVKCKTSR